MSALAPARRIGNKFQNPVETHVGGAGLFWKVLRLYLHNKAERVPLQRLRPLQTDTAIYQEPPQTGLRITWMGHSTMLIEMGKIRVLIDPVWDKRASPIQWAGPKRFFAAPLALEDLPRVDIVLLSHDHYDHMGKQTIRKLTSLKARWVTSLGVGRRLSALGVRETVITELDWTESTNVADLTITALPARHFSGRSTWDRFETLWSSFVIRNERHNLYYGADSGAWDGFAEIGHRYGPFDLTMLEIGAYNDLWRDIHMGPEGAAKAFRDMGGIGLMMPIHWGLFDLALHAWRQPIERMNELANTYGIKLWSPTPGIPTEVVDGQEHQSDWYK